MRTTLNIDDALVRAAKELARAEGTTLTALVHRGLREVLTPVPPPTTSTVRLPTYGSPTGRHVSSEQIKDALDDEARSAAV